MRRNLGDGVEITVTTFWESMDAIAKFAGNEPEIAVVSPVVQTIMRAFDSTVTHYEIVLDQGRRTTSSTHS
jgi:heme-degrading monooxygenase HmoA